MKKLIVAAIITVAGLAPAHAASESLGMIGKWTIKRFVNPMTDAKRCIAFYTENENISTAKDSFIMAYFTRGGVSRYRIRFDDDAASPSLSPDDHDRQHGIVGSNPATFQRFLHAKRLRIEVDTATNSVVDDDVDLTDMPQVMNRLNGPDC